MREILFRGKRKDTGEWVYGWFCPKDLEPTTFAVIYTPCIIREKDLLWCEVLPETVGQYTGLTDKNGTKIFEGDILQRADNDKWVISFHKVMFAAQRLKYPIHRLSTEYWHKGCVIGNIHDNPELAKEKGRG